MNRRPAMRHGLIAVALLTSLGVARADIRFDCPGQLPALQKDVLGYLSTLGLPAVLVAQDVDADARVLTLALTTPPGETRTLDFAARPAFQLSTERVRLPTGKNKTRLTPTVSRKEILLALLQHGRTTEFHGEACSLEALTDHIGVRQNIVVWAENLSWVWPDGGSAKWNPKYWKNGTPRPGVPLHTALMDVFLHQDKYAIGCYTAAKIVVAQGVLDYYRRVKGDPLRSARVTAALLADGEPLVGVEPGAMWNFEADFDPRDQTRPGKLLTLHATVAPDNFVPGDWGYLLNTDAVSYQKTGYEGSNAIYLGRNRFGDFYNDRHHGYTYEQKLNDVYQWRNGVFNRVRDANKIQPLSAADLARLSATPARGGLQLDIRATPKAF
jgi:hypothetical protein